ncbi:MAG: hypothetical protein K9G38_01755 [Bacteroidales bacterium]|nr:hypothetical protein [Bacteroidales bacterium]
MCGILLMAALLFVAGSSAFGQTGTFTVTHDISYKSGDDYVNERCRLDIRAPGVYQSPVNPGTIPRHITLSSTFSQKPDPPASMITTRR